MFEDIQASKGQDKNVFLQNGTKSDGNFQIHNKDLKNFIKITPCDQTTKKLNINLKLCSEIYPDESILSKERIATLLQILEKIKNNRKIIKYFRILSIHFDKIEYLLTIVFAINQFEESQKFTSLISSMKKQTRKKSNLRNFISFLFWEYHKFIESSKDFHEIDCWYLLFDEKTFNILLAQDHGYEFSPYIYEPLLLRIILQKTVIKEYVPLKHLNFPFIDLALLLKSIKRSEDIMDNQSRKIFFWMEQCQQQEFNYTLNQIMAIQMESTNLRPKEKIELFLQCPFFWDDNKRILQLMQFKEKFGNHNSQQYDRQKKNEYLRIQIQYQIQLKKKSKDQDRLKEFIKNFNPENYELSGSGDKKYIPANSVAKNSQLFFIYGGIVEIEGNMDSRISKDRPIPYITTKFKTLQFQWNQKKSDHFSFPHEKDKSNEPDHLYDHIRAMRNFCSHSRIRENGLTFLRQQKVRTVQGFYPTIFNFIHKWNKVIDLKLIKEQEYSEQSTVKQLVCKILVNLFPENLNAQTKLLRLKEIRKLDQFRKYKLEWSFKESTCQVCNQLIKAYDIFGYFYECKDFGILFEEHKEGVCQWLKSQTVKLRKKKNIMTALNMYITKQDKFDKFRQYLKDKIQKKGDAVYEDIYKNSDYISKIMLYNILEKFPNILQDIRIHRYIWDQSSKGHLKKLEEKNEQNKKEKQQLQKKNIEQDQRDRNLSNNSNLEIKSTQIVLDISRQSKISQKQEIIKEETILENSKEQKCSEKTQIELIKEDKINTRPHQPKKQSDKQKYNQKKQQKQKKIKETFEQKKVKKEKRQHQTKNWKNDLERRQSDRTQQIGFKEKKAKKKYVEKIEKNCS